MIIINDLNVGDLVTPIYDEHLSHYWSDRDIDIDKTYVVNFVDYHEEAFSIYGNNRNNHWWGTLDTWTCRPLPPITQG